MSTSWAAAAWPLAIALPLLLSCEPNRAESRALPSVLLISIDTCRADYLGCYGGPPGITPALDRLAADGVLFENVVSPAPITLPAHASMLTGLNPIHHGLHDNYGGRLADRHETLAEGFERAGYRTGAIVSAGVLDAAFGLEQGFASYDDAIERPLEKNAVVQRRGAETTRLAVEWLGKHAGRRTFLFLHYFDPHANYEPPEPFLGRFQPDRYAGEIAYTDHCIGGVIDRLKQQGLYDSTLIMVTADHGEMRGEHEEDTHSYFIYQGAVRVPLIVKLPGQTGSRRIEETVGLVDIMPTLYGLLGRPLPGPADGVDLSLVLRGEGEPAADRSLYCESFTPTKYGAGPLLGLVKEGIKYIRSKRPELYDLAADPAESRNLYATRPRLAAAMHEELERMLAGAAEAKPADRLDDEEAVAGLAALGYVRARIDDAIELDPARADAKDLLDDHIMAMQVERMILLGELTAAESMSLEMIRRNPSCALGYRFRFTVAFKGGRYDQAITAGREALRLDPDDSRLWKNIGAACVGAKKPDEAIEAYREYLARRPGDALTRTHLGEICMQVGRFDEAVAQLEKAVDVAPDLAEAHHALGNAYRSRGDRARALQEFERVLVIDPRSAASHYNLANLLASEGRIAESLEHYRRTLELAPDHVGAGYNLGWFLVMDDKAPFYDPVAAVEVLRRTNERSGGRRADLLGTLGVAQAATGRYAEASEVTRRAIELAEAAGDADLAAALREKRRLYEAGRPFHQALHGGRRRP